MDATHKSILPETVQALVEEIQTFAGFEIGVGENPKPPNPNDPPESSGSELTDEQLARISAGEHPLSVLAPGEKPAGLLPDGKDAGS